MSLRRVAPFLAILAPALGAALTADCTARAAVFQAVDNTPLPQPVGAAERVDCSMRGWGYARDQQIYKDFDGNQLNPPILYSDLFPTFEDGDAVTLSGLFKWRKEQIDPVKDARTEPGYFSPSCGFTGELVLRGGSCSLALGWYNVLDPANPTPPAASEIYELVPPDVETYMHCMDQNGQPLKPGAGFCPQGWDPHIPYNLTVLGWQPKAFDSGTIAQDPHYKGKYVAFALIGNPNVQCKQTKHSIAAHNTKSTAGPPWITTLIWQSTIDPEAFYIGFEDLPMSPDKWTDAGPGQANGCDGDFNDFVFYISGISCQGGGQACDTGLQGACSLGRTDCSIGSEPGTCHPIIQPGKELCDNVDNDCNGFVDDGSGLCPEGQVCDKGVCVGACNTGEFACPNGQQCKAGFCIDLSCVSVECTAGQACRNGKCVNACDGVTCPVGQECQLGRCVDACAGIQCPAGRVCEKGLCVSNCACRGCQNGLTCNAADGRCVDTACGNITCDAGKKCQAGKCIDPCEGVVCPGGMICVDGHCPDPISGSGGTGSGNTTGNGGGIGFINQGGSISIGTGSGSSNPSGNSGTGNSSGGRRSSAEPSGCGCRVVESNDNIGGWLVAVGAAFLVAARRSRRREKAANTF